MRRTEIHHLIWTGGVLDCFRGCDGAPCRGWIPAFAGMTEVGGLRAGWAYISPRRSMRWTDMRWMSQMMPKVISAKTASMKK